MSPPTMPSGREPIAVLFARYRRQAAEIDAGRDDLPDADAEEAVRRACAQARRESERRGSA